MQMTQKTLPSHASVVVIGGGIMGSSTLYHLAKMGVETERGTWPNPSLALIDEGMEHLFQFARLCMEARLLTDDPILKRYGTLSAFHLTFGEWLGYIGKETLGKWQKLGAEMGGEQALVDTICGYEFHADSPVCKSIG